MVVPLPFSRAVFVYGKPIPVPRDGDIDEWKGRVADALNELSERAEQEANR
jgi:lysophospholipid acyltransferase (LPLAT)-like uncharacterized protein